MPGQIPAVFKRQVTDNGRFKLASLEPDRHLNQGAVTQLDPGEIFGGLG
jgi:hypothetical protein